MTELLTLQEAAKELRISIHTLRVWVYQKRIPVVRLGRRIFIRRKDLEEFIAKNVVKAKEDWIRF